MTVNKHQIYLKMARDYAQMSKCRKIQVGCMIVNNGRIVSTGVNGTPKGMCNCTDHFYAHDAITFNQQHSEWSQEHEVHAEMNALLYAAKSNVEVTADCILYCTHEPCNNCLKHIAVTGIKQIYYIDKYYNNTIDNKYKINITQLNIDTTDIVTQKIKPIEIIVNARKILYEFETISFSELVYLCFGTVTQPELYTADFKFPYNSNFTEFEPNKIIAVFPGTQFRCTGSTPVWQSTKI